MNRFLLLLLLNGAWAELPKSTDSITFHILKEAGLPDKEQYPKFWKDNTLKIVDEIPEENLDKVKKVEYYILSARLSAAFRESHQVDERLMNAMSHNGIGFRMLDENDNEVYRLASSFWGCQADIVDSPVLDKNNVVRVYNRAIVAFSISHNEWEGGYWSMPKHLGTISVPQYKQALTDMKNFAIRHPFIQGYELWTPDNRLLSPAITCNTYMQDMTWKTVQKDIYAENIMAQAYSTVVLRQLPPNGATEQSLNFPMFWPKFYDEHGTFQCKDGVHDVPWVVGLPKKLYLRNNQNLEVDVWKYMKEASFIPQLMEV